MSCFRLKRLSSSSSDSATTGNNVVGSFLLDVCVVTLRRQWPRLIVHALLVAEVFGEVKYLSSLIVVNRFMYIVQLHIVAQETKVVV